MELLKTKSGHYSVKYNNKHLNSIYDPIYEAKRFAKYINKEDYQDEKVMIYGLGLGYHITEIVKKLGTNHIYYVFEASLEIVELCKVANPDVIKNKCIKLITLRDKNFFQLFSKGLQESKDIIIHRPSLELIKNSNKQFYNIINNFYNTRELMNKERELLIENYNSNIKTNCKNIREFLKDTDWSDKKVIMVASGPSLDDDIETLKKIKDKFHIIAVGSSFRRLMDYGIKPEAIVIIDNKIWVREQVKNYENEDIPLLFLSTASRWAVDDYKGPKYIFFNDINSNEVYVETGKTVSAAAISIAILCKAKDIIFLGLDLAFIDGKLHSEDNSMYKKYNIENMSDSLFKDSEKVMGVNGQYLKTTKGFLIFKKNIEKIIELNNSINFYNASNGAVISKARNVDIHRVHALC